jgi:hypothetical protein
VSYFVQTYKTTLVLSENAPSKAPLHGRTPHFVFRVDCACGSSYFASTKSNQIFFQYIYIYFSCGHRLPLAASHKCLELPSPTFGIGMSKGKPFLSLPTVSKHLQIELLQCLLLTRPATLAFTCSPASWRSSQNLLLWS